jgi:hypothetical protein
LGTALAAYHHCLLEAAQDSAVLAAMGSALKEQLPFCLLPSSKVIASIWGHLVLGSCHPQGLADFFSLFTCLFSFSVFCGFFLSFCFFVSLVLLMQCLLC